MVIKAAISARQRLQSDIRSSPLLKRGMQTIAVAIIIIVTFALLPSQVTAAKVKYVTCGSAIYMKHTDTNYKLFSAGITWGSGSGQQAVTAHDSENDRSLLWLVKEGQGRPACSSGQPVKCGDIIRLEHLETAKNVHSHLVPSPLSTGKEVSVFGEAGEGDTGDNWSIICDGGSNEGHWKANEKVNLKHNDTGGFLRTAKRSLFTHNNCPRCPIVGHGEVSVSEPGKSTKDDYWTAIDGVTLSATDDDDHDGEDREEL